MGENANRSSKYLFCGLNMNTWTYNAARAQLKLNDETFALVTPDGRSALPPEKVKQLLDDLCQTKLGRLQAAVREHAAEIDKIMNGPASYARGQQIAQSVSRLELAVAETQADFDPQTMAAARKSLSAPTSPGSAATPASSSPGPTAKPSSRAASTRRRRPPSKV